jgi:hypothetical protein
MSNNVFAQKSNLVKPPEQKTNLNKLPEYERNEYLLKTAYFAVMRHAPDWYRDYKEPEISSRIVEVGPDKGKLVYNVIYFFDPQKEQMLREYSIRVTIYADTGKVRGLRFGDNTGLDLSRATDDKPYVHPGPRPRQQPRGKLILL